MNTDIAYEVGRWLQGANLGTLGTDVFVGQMPATTNGIYIIRSSGAPNNYVPIEEAVVDIYAKNAGSETAVESLENIKRTMHRMHSTETTNTYIYTYLVIGDVTDVSRDQEYGKIYKISVQVLHRSKSLIS